MRPSRDNQSKRHQVVNIILLLSIFACIGIILYISRPTQASPQTTVSSGNSATSSETATSPTEYSEIPPIVVMPFPTIILPPMTPVPHADEEPLPQTIIPVEPEPEPTPPDADLPFNATEYVLKTPSTQFATEDSTIILIGTVKQVQQAQWTTPDGRRPTNPHAKLSPFHIFRPALVDIEEIIKGEAPDHQINVFAWGGVVGQDSYVHLPDDLFDIKEGEKVVLFLLPHTNAQDVVSLGSKPYFDIREHYTLTADDLATNYYRSIPLPELRAEIQKALSH